MDLLEEIRPVRRISDGHDGGAVAVVFSLLEGAGEVTLGGPLSIAFAPSIVGMEVAASHPMENHPADDPPSASNSASSRSAARDHGYYADRYHRSSFYNPSKHNRRQRATNHGGD